VAEGAVGVSFAKEEKARRARAEKIRLFRYELIREAAGPGLTARERGRIVRALADAEHIGPFGAPVRAARESLDRWIRWWRTGGFDALVPEPRRSEPRTDPAVLQLAVALKRENPARDAVQTGQILWASGVGGQGTIRCSGTCPGPVWRGPFSRPRRWRSARFEAAKPHDLWVGDALHGPVVAGAQGASILLPGRLLPPCRRREVGLR